MEWDSSPSMSMDDGDLGLGRYNDKRQSVSSADIRVRFAQDQDLTMETKEQDELEGDNVERPGASVSVHDR